jgi:hypothetical protein
MKKIKINLRLIQETMINKNIFSGLGQNSLNNFELNQIRGGSKGSGGGYIVIDEDILLPDPEPDKANP